MNECCSLKLSDLIMDNYDYDPNGILDLDLYIIDNIDSEVRFTLIRRMSEVLIDSSHFV